MSNWWDQDLSYYPGPRQHQFAVGQIVAYASNPSQPIGFIQGLMPNITSVRIVDNSYPVGSEERSRHEFADDLVPYSAG